jgi:hypothetical protein
LSGDRLKARLTPTFSHSDVTIAEGSAGHYVQRPILGRVLFATPAPFHDFGSLIFSHNALHLEQQIIFGALAEWPVQED